jgi:hypothetical protein
MRRVIALILLAAFLTGSTLSRICADGCEPVRLTASGTTACHGQAVPADVLTSSHDCTGTPAAAPAVVTRLAPSALADAAPRAALVDVAVVMVSAVRPLARAIVDSPPLFRAATPLRI